MWGINLESVAVNSNIEILDNTIYGYRNKGTGITVRGYNITVSGNNISNFMQGFHAMICLTLQLLIIICLVIKMVYYYLM